MSDSRRDRSSSYGFPRLNTALGPVAFAAGTETHFNVGVGMAVPRFLNTVQGAARAGDQPHLDWPDAPTHTTSTSLLRAARDGSRLAPRQ
jgi:hypothetical protein